MINPIKVEVHTARYLHMALTEDQARWLMGFIQNFPGDPDDEGAAEFCYRKEIFAGLSEALNPPPLAPPASLPDDDPF